MRRVQTHLRRLEPIAGVTAGFPGRCGSQALFTISADRYGGRSLGITSNLVCSEWERIFANPVFTAAAIDRVVDHSAILEFDVPG